MAGGYCASAAGDCSFAWGAGSNVFYINSSGAVYGDGSYSSPAADYAEMFPNQCSGIQLCNGRFVSLCQGESVGHARADTEIIGVVSTNPVVLGDSASLKWKDKFITDKWGNIVWEEITVVTQEAVKAVDGVEGVDAVEAVEEELWAEGDDLPEGTEIGDVKVEAVEAAEEVEEVEEMEAREEVTRTYMEKVINPDFDPSAVYVPRSDRKDEWTAVGLLGKLFVEIADGHSIVMGDKVKSDDDGKAIKDDNGWPVLLVDSENNLAKILYN
jgi:hypothetical protein